MAEIRLSKVARADLRTYRDWLCAEAGQAIADRWTDSLIDWIEELDTFPERGSPRPDLGAEIRTRVFRRRVTIAYVVADDVVTILGIFARGRNIIADAVATMD